MSYSDVSLINLSFCQAYSRQRRYSSHSLTGQTAEGRMELRRLQGNLADSQAGNSASLWREETQKSLCLGQYH